MHLSFEHGYTGAKCTGTVCLLSGMAQADGGRWVRHRGQQQAHFAEVRLRRAWHHAEPCPGTLLIISASLELVNLRQPRPVPDMFAFLFSRARFRAQVEHRLRMLLLQRADMECARLQCATMSLRAMYAPSQAAFTVLSSFKVSAWDCAASERVNRQQRDAVLCVRQAQRAVALAGRAWPGGA